MTKGTTRRGLLTSGTALVVSLGVWGAVSKLFGQTRTHPKAARHALTGQERRTMESELPVGQSHSRSVERVLTAGAPHWVGDGFFVRSVIAPDGDPSLQSPFLLIDHAARRVFTPAAQRRGVGEHPHRGFETVTFAYRGEIEHRDSAGGGGTIGPGDVQWMTAGAGIVHEEMHSQRFTEQGGEMEMVQLWVNLPASKKRTAPAYQSLLDKDFPRVTLGSAEARLVAGTLGGKSGPAQTHTPITIFDLEFATDGEAEFSLPLGHQVLTLTLVGDVFAGHARRHVEAGQLAVWRRNGNSSEHMVLHGQRGARMLVLSGEPLDEPVSAYGPFVMNTREEIIQAMRDYQSGKMGHLP